MFSSLSTSSFVSQFLPPQEDDHHVSSAEESQEIQTLQSEEPILPVSSSSQPLIISAAQSVVTVAASVTERKIKRTKNFSLPKGRWKTFSKQGTNGSKVLTASRVSPVSEKDKKRTFSDLILKDLICDSIYYPLRHANKIELVGFERFSEIIIPEINMENCMSKCFHDPVLTAVSSTEAASSSSSSSPVTEEQRRGKVHESFKYLQAEASSCSSLANHELIGASYVNNYPDWFSQANVNCDAYGVWHFPLSGCYLSIVTDGCGLGQNSREAAQIAVAVCSRYIRAKLSEEQTLESLTKMVIEALEKAQQQLIFKPETPKTTTITISLAFIASSGETYLLVVMLGDIKCYLTSLSETERLMTVDLTQNTRVGFDATDSGGNLGGFYPDPLGSRNYIHPRLDNLSVTCCLLPKTQQHFVMIATDGLTDCFDPEKLRLTVQQAHSFIPEFFAELWEHLLPDVRHKIIVKHSTELLSNIFLNAISQAGGDLDRLCARYTQFSKATTMGERNWMTENPNRTAPKDHPFFLGKMDHTTMTCFMIPQKRFTSVDTSTATSSSSSSSSLSSSTTYSGHSSFA